METSIPKRNSNFNSMQQTNFSVLRFESAHFSFNKLLDEVSFIFEQIPPARLEALDEAINDVKLRQMLWKNSKEWLDMYQSW